MSIFLDIVTCVIEWLYYVCSKWDDRKTSAISITNHTACIERPAYLVGLQELDLVEAVALLHDDGVRVLAAAATAVVLLGLGLAVRQHVLQAGQGHLKVKLN